MTDSVEPTKTYALTFLGLMLLLALTVGASYIHLGPLNWLAAVCIAVLKTVLIAYFFMHLKSTSRVAWLAAGAGITMFVILATLVLADLFSRAW